MFRADEDDVTMGKHVIIFFFSPPVRIRTLNSHLRKCTVYITIGIRYPLRTCNIIRGFRDKTISTTNNNSRARRRCRYGNFKYFRKSNRFTNRHDYDLIGFVRIVGV